MIRFLGKVYAKAIGFFAVLILILGPVIGFIAGKEAATADTNEIVLGIVSAIIGLIIAFIADVVIFGYMAQILDLRNNVEKIQKKIGD